MNQNIQVTNGKISDKVFMQTIVTSILSIILCIVSLCSMTFAWFHEETTSNENALLSGSFNFEASVVRKDAAEGEAALAVTEDPHKKGVWVCELPREGVYVVTLILTDDTNVKGHCKVTLGSDTPKRTVPIIGEQTKNRGTAAITAPFIFTVTVTEAQTITLEPRWGIAVTSDIEYKASYPIATLNPNS